MSLYRSLRSRVKLLFDLDRNIRRTKTMKNNIRDNNIINASSSSSSSSSNPLHLISLNHISLVCRSVDETLDFYQNVLGFFPILRPCSFGFYGAWLFNYGIGIHLIQSEDPEHMPKIRNKINPKDNHISFQCESMGNVEKKLKEMEIEYVRSRVRVEEGGVHIDQLFFHDPDGTMIEICNCNNIPVVPLPARRPIRPSL